MDEVTELFSKNEDPDYLESFLQKYQLIEVLGSGSFSSVFHVVCEEQHFAVKVLNKHALGRQIDKLRNEASILSKMNHPNIIHFIETVESQRKLYFFMELVKGVTLNHYITTVSLLNDQIVSIIRQILVALQYIHDLDIIHRDLKLENIMLTYDGVVKIIDFGLSFKALSFQTTHDTCGTLIFMAPEMASRGEYFKPVDIWSCGIIQYMLFSKGQHPLWNQDEDTRESYTSKLLANHEWKFPQNMNKSAQSFFNKTANRFPESRMSAGQALRHPWITGCGELTQPLTMTDLVQQFSKEQEFSNFIKGVLFIKYLNKKCKQLNITRTITLKLQNLKLSRQLESSFKHIESEESEEGDEIGKRFKFSDQSLQQVNVLSPTAFKRTLRRSTPNSNSQQAQKQPTNSYFQHLQEAENKQVQSLIYLKNNIQKHNKSGSLLTFYDDETYDRQQLQSQQEKSFQQKKKNLVLPPIVPQMKKLTHSSNSNSPNSKGMNDRISILSSRDGQKRKSNFANK